MRVKFCACAMLLLQAVAFGAVAQDHRAGCGAERPAGRFGPFDYRIDKYVYESTYGSHAKRVWMVEQAHFTKKTEMLIRMRPNVPVGSDLSYTLDAYPNHHRALIALIRLGELEKTEQPLGSSNSIDCWFRKAFAFAPDDRIVRLINAQHLIATGKNSEAIDMLRLVATMGENEPFTQHNIGLLYFDMKDYDSALLQSHKAYRMGMTNQTLREQLTRVGKWVEPTDVGSGGENAKTP